MDTIYQQISEVGQQLLMAGINPPFSGNISVRNKEAVFITTHGSNLGALKKDELVKVGLHNTDPQQQASVQLKIHQSIYNAIPQAGAIVHAHPPAAISLSFKLEEIIPLDMEGRFYLPEIPVIFITYNEYLLLAPQQVSAALKEHQCLIVRGHGTFVWGKTLREAFHLTVVAEQICRLIINDTLLDRS